MIPKTLAPENGVKLFAIMDYHAASSRRPFSKGPPPGAIQGPFSHAE
jgi:hypothetical protein